MGSTLSHTKLVSKSPGDRLISSGEVTEERVVRGVLGEGSVSQALHPLGGGVGICTPDRWQQFSGLDIQASSNFSLSQSSGNIEQMSIKTQKLQCLKPVISNNRNRINEEDTCHPS